MLFSKKIEDFLFLELCIYKYFIPFIKILTLLHIISFESFFTPFYAKTNKHTLRFFLRDYKFNQRKIHLYKLLIFRNKLKLISQSIIVPINIISNIVMKICIKQKTLIPFW